MIRSPAAIPELIEVIRRYGGDLGEEAAEALGRFGAVAFEPVLDACRDPEISGNSRTHARNAAVYTAGDDPSRRAGLPTCCARCWPTPSSGFDWRKAQEEAERDEHDEDSPEVDYEEEPGEGSGVDEESDHEPIEAESADAPMAEEKDELDLNSEIFYLVNDLSALADPKARNLLKAAFDEDMVPRFFLDEEAVERAVSPGR